MGRFDSEWWGFLIAGLLAFRVVMSLICWGWHTVTLNRRIDHDVKVAKVHLCENLDTDHKLVCLQTIGSGR